jgi:hypothetical protein
MSSKNYVTRLAEPELVQAADEEARDWVDQNPHFSEMRFIAQRTISEFILNRNGYTRFKKDKKA